MADFAAARESAKNAARELQEFLTVRHDPLMKRVLAASQRVIDAK